MFVIKRKKCQKLEVSIFDGDSSYLKSESAKQKSFSEPGAARKMMDDEEQVRRAADREGRRTRRRQIRERIDINNTHLDGMSSDDEIHQDRDTLNFKTQLGEN